MHINANRLFFTRGIIYLILIALPYLFPDIIVVRYDNRGLLLLFFCIPLAALWAMYADRWLRIQWQYEIAIALFTPPLIAMIFNELSSIWYISILSWLAYFTSKSYFRRTQGARSWQGLLAVVEILFSLSIIFRLLNFSRTQAEIFELGVRLLLFLLLTVFFIHAWILYSALSLPSMESQQGQSVQKKTLGWPTMMRLILILPLIFFVVTIIPLDPVQHKSFLNNLWEEPPSSQNLRGGNDAQQQNQQNGLPLGKREEKYPSQLQNEKQGSAPNQDNDSSDDANNQVERGQNSRLEGIPSEQWDQLSQNQQQPKKPEKQYALMIVQALIHPVYLAESYYDDYSIDKGFQVASTAREPLNKLSKLQLIDIWENQIDALDENRRLIEIFVMTSLSERVLPFKPFRIEPTIQNNRYHPFSLSYRSQSRISGTVRQDWRQISALELEASTRNDDLKIYLNYPQQLKSDAKFSQQMLALVRRSASALKLSNQNTPDLIAHIVNKLPSDQRLALVLRSFDSFQYALGFSDTTNFKRIRDFVIKDKKGKCTEFAATAVLLARLLQLPSRLVTGYLASRDLQSPTHRQGLAHLQEKIEPLQEYPIDELYLVTTVHKHAWLQVYLPRYGWIDLESTVHAKPPQAGENPNELDLVIPLIDEEGYALANPKYEFPWQWFLSIIGLALASLFILLYGYRYGEQLYYAYRGRKKYSDGFHFAYRSFLLALAYDGYPVLMAFQTPLQYAQQLLSTKKIPSSAPFVQKIEQNLIDIAKKYTELHLRMRWIDAQLSKQQAIDDFYRNLTEGRRRCKRRGFIAAVMRKIRLRGLGLAK